LLLAIKKPRQDARAQATLSVLLRLNFKCLLSLQRQTILYLTLTRPLLAFEKFAAVVLKLIRVLLEVWIVLQVAYLLRVVELQQTLLKQRPVVVIQIKLLYQSRLVHLAVEVALAEAPSEGLVVAHSQNRLKQSD
jgi:hypothetical protein